MNVTTLPDTTHLGDAPLGHLDAVLAAAHMIPLQEDVPGMLRMLKYCSLPLMAFQRICVMLDTPLREQDRLYALDVATNSVDCSRVAMSSEQGRYEMFHQREPSLLTGEELIAAFPAAARLEVFRGVRYCLLQPLFVGVHGYHSIMAFVWTGDVPSGEDMVPLCRVLGCIAAAGLTRILQDEERNMEIAVLRQERDHLNILVGIANVANSTLKLDSLVDMVGMDLRRFFSVNDVAILLREGGGRASLYGALVGGGREKSVPRGTVVPLERSLLRYFRRGEAFRLLRENALQNVRATDPLAALFLAHGDTAVCCVPLVSRQREMGLLALAHSQESVFTRDVISLLAQIALSVACAVYNAREYASVRTASQRRSRENASPASAIGQSGGEQQWQGGEDFNEGEVRQAIITAVRACNGLIAGPRGAAALLGLNRTTLNSRMKRLGLSVKRIMEE